MGIKVGSVEHDPNEMQDWKDGIVKKLTTGVRALLKMNGAELMIGEAVDHQPQHRQRQPPTGEKETFTADKGIVLATGATTIELPTFKFDGQQIIGAKEAVSLRHVPKRLCVIGGGIIGMELGQVYQKLRLAAHGRRGAAHILNGVDPTARSSSSAASQARRQDPHGAKAMGYEKQADGSLAVASRKDGKPETVVVRRRCSSRSACAPTRRTSASTRPA
jgi:dihydrolipoamide dehydrogenase